MLARFTEHWSPKKIAQVNDYDVRIVKVQGEFRWHQQGIEHCPRASTETALLLFEPGSVVNTGDAGGELTAEVEHLT